MTETTTAAGPHLALAMQHADAAAAAKAAIELELQLRAKLVEAVFPDGPRFGVNRADLGGGYSLKVEVGKNPRLDVPKVNVALELMRGDGELGEQLAGRVIRYKPELVLREFDQLPERFRELFGDGAVTIAKATPSVVLEKPVDKLTLIRAI